MGIIRRFAAMNVFVLALFIVLSAQPSSVFAFEVLAPPLGEKNVVHARRSVSHLVVKASGPEEAARLKVGRVANREGDIEAITRLGSWNRDGAVYLHYALKLKKGKNIYAVNPGEKELVIQYQPMRTLLRLDPDDPNVYLFHRNEVVPGACSSCHDEKLPADAGLDVTMLSKNADFSPVCYSCHRGMTAENKWLHGPAAAVACLTCHRKGNDSNKITTLVGRVDDVCFSCHINKRQWTRDTYIHGPAATGDCTVCHDPHGADFPFMLWADPKIDICIACHTDKKGIKTKKQGYYEHGIIEGSGCSACHSPHASNYRFQLPNTINKTCVSCHISLQGVEKGHPVGNHPLSGVDDPRRKGRELACSGCHNPHGSRYQHLLIGSLLGGHVCSKCHN